MGPTFPNRFFQHGAQTDRISNIRETTTIPTIWDRLAERGIAAKYYFSDVPFIALWGPKYRGITYPFAQFLRDVREGSMERREVPEKILPQSPEEGPWMEGAGRALECNLLFRKAGEFWRGRP